MDRLQLTAVYCDRRGCKDNTPNDPFSRCKSVQQFGYRWNWRSQNTVWLQQELQHPEGKKFTLGIASAWWNRARHQWQRDHQDPEHLQHSAHEHWHVSAQFSCLLVRFLSSWFTHCTAWFKGVAHVISSMHEVCGSPSTLSPPFPSTSSSSHSSFISCTSSCISSITLRAVASLCTPPERVWTLLTTPTSSHLELDSGHQFLIWCKDEIRMRFFYTVHLSLW